MTTRLVTAGDGRQLALCEWGDPHGAPVFWLHGTPGSRYMRHHDESVYVDAGARVITYDRAGYGQSTRRRGRTVVDVVEDVVAIADALGVERFSVGGRSGGAPHALAVAAELGDRVVRCASVVGIGPWDADDLDFMRGMAQGNVEEFGWALEGEEVLHRNMEPRCVELLEAIRAGQGLGSSYELSEADRAAAAAHADTLAEAVGEAFAPGIWGLVDDDLAFSKPWGFDVADIEVPTQVWYGADDTLVPQQHGEWLAGHIPGAEDRRMEGGHLGLEGHAAAQMAWLAAH